MLLFAASLNIDLAPKVFNFLSVAGHAGGYMVAIAILYAAVNKKIALQGAILVLSTMVLNHLLKALIKNPRPFVPEGTYIDNWAVSHERAIQLATDFSTPSGHAMAATAFYGFLFLKTKNRLAKTFFVIFPIAIGISRTGLGVHYFQDIILGWLIGGAIAVLGWVYSDRFLDWWCALSKTVQILAPIIVTFAFWSAVLVSTGKTTANYPSEFMSIPGFLTGVLVAAPLEREKFNFSASSSSSFGRILRLVFMILLLLVMTFVLDVLIIAMLGDINEISGSHLTVVRYLKYVIMGFAGIFIPSWIFARHNFLRTKSKSDA